MGSLVYLWTFRSQLLKATEAQKNQIANAQNHDTDTVSIQDTHSPQNCYKYARCATSMINVTILSVAVPAAFLYYRYWEDPLYETPGITFYALSSALAHFMVDVVAGILVHFRYQTISIPWDVVLHHVIVIGFILWVEVALPHYVWTWCAMIIFT